MPLRLSLSLVLLIAGLVSPVQAQSVYTQQGSKLVPGNVIGSPALGVSAAISADGNTLVAGGPQDNGSYGAVWVYTRSNGGWNLQAKLVSSDKSSLGVPGQGSSVAISADGNTIVVGGMDDNRGTGAMWSFVRSNGVWTQFGPRLWGTVLGDETTHIAISHQGISIAISGDGTTALLGGDVTDQEKGAAWLYTRGATQWSLVPVKLVGDTTGSAHQGASVALSNDGNTALIGAPGDSNGLGTAVVFTRSGGVWAQQGSKLIPGGATGGANFGSSAALSADGNTAIIGGSGDSNYSGAVWVFTRTNTQWTQQGSKLTGSHQAPDRYLGDSVAVTADGNNLLAGGPGGVYNVFRTTKSVGAVWHFSRINGQWSQQGTEFSGVGTAGGDALQGSSVALAADGTTAVVGGPADNGNVGAAWVFTRPAAPSPPVITSQPASQTIASAQSITLTVIATGAAPLNYQWYQGNSGNVSLPVGVNSPSFTTPALIGATSYWVRVSNLYGTADSSTAILSLATTGPVITQVVTVANGSPVISPNTWVEVHGTNLAPPGSNRLWMGSDFVNNQMPRQLDTVTATVNGRSAFVEYISPGQVNILTPPDSLQGAVQVLVGSNGVSSAPFTVNAQPLAPAFFVFPSSPYAAAEHTSGAYLGPASLFAGVTPAKPGETVVLFGSGFGPTSPVVVSGSSVQNGILPSPPVITIGGIPASVKFAGLIGPGEFQFNVVVPDGVPDGDNAVIAVYGGLTSQTGVLLTIQR